MNHGIGLIDSNAPFIQSILASPKDPKEVLKWLKSKPVNFQKKTKICQGKNKQSDKNIILRLGDDRDILQVSITEADSDGPDSYLSLHVMSKKKIDPGSTKIHGFSIDYSNSKKEMVDKDGIVLDTVTSEEAAEKVTEYLKARIDTNVEQVLPVVHNGHSFDQNRFVTLIDKSCGLSNFEDRIYFGDSYHAGKKVLIKGNIR